MVIGHRGHQISCRGREMFCGSNLVLQWVPGSGKVVRGDTEMSPGRVSPGVLQGGCEIPNVTSKLFPRQNEAAKHNLVEFKVQCLKIFCCHGNKSIIL